MGCIRRESRLSEIPALQEPQFHTPGRVSGKGRTFRFDRGFANGWNRRNLAVHQAVDEGRVAALLWTSIIAACKVYALASCLRASWMEARPGTA
jgi:hypothetical protein